MNPKPYTMVGDDKLYLITGAQLRALETYYGQNRLLFSWLIKQIRNEQIYYGKMNNDQLLKAAAQALRSYQYGNTSPDLAKEIADKIEEYYGRLQTQQEILPQETTPTQPLQPKTPRDDAGRFTKKESCPASQ